MRSHALGHQLVQARALDPVDCLRRWRANVLLDVGAVHKGRVWCGTYGSAAVLTRRGCRGASEELNVGYIPIASEMLEVVMTRTFLWCFSRSSCVRTALTTRTASEGSRPPRDADLAVARLSTSSGARHACQQSCSSTAKGDKRGRTNENDHECILLFDQLEDHGEEALDQLARLGEPLGKERVRVDLDELGACVLGAEADGEFLRKRFAQTCLARARRTV